MLLFLLNCFCVFLYFVFVSLILIFLLYRGVLPSGSKIRYRFNLIDFYFDILKCWAYDLKNTPKDAFRESGIIMYEGCQGSGKTISMIHDIMMLQHKYPKVKVIDNLNYKYHDQDMQHPNQLINFKNGVYGVIAGVDECGIWFNNRDFKDFGKDSNMLQVIFENRKVRRLFLGTTQKFNLVDKNIRIQTSLVRSCHTILFGALTFYIEKVPYFDSEGTVTSFRFRKIKFFVQTKDLRDAYDTYHVITKFKLKNEV